MWYDVDFGVVSVYMEVRADAAWEPFFEWIKKGRDTFIWLGPVHLVISWGTSRQKRRRRDEKHKQFPRIRSCL